MYSYIADIMKEYKKKVYTKFIDKRFYYLSLIKESNGEKPYSIHGLWPQNNIDNPKDYPTYCRNVTFSVYEIKPLLSKLKLYWYSGNNINPNDLDDENFWKHEYEKHGSCMFEQLNEYDYFNITLNLYQEVIDTDIPDKYYNSDNNTCLIPISLDFKLLNL